MRLLLLCFLLLTLMVGAAPGGYRAGGSLSNPSFRIKGRLIEVEGKIFPTRDLRECQQLRVQMKLTNQTAGAAHYPVYVAAFDPQGRLLGAGAGHTGKLPPG